jgi:hypothetical protein
MNVLVGTEKTYVQQGSRGGTHLVKLFKCELLRLPHEQEGANEGEDVCSGVKACNIRFVTVGYPPKVPAPPKLRSWKGNLIPSISFAPDCITVRDSPPGSG